MEAWAGHPAQQRLSPALPWVHCFFQTYFCSCVCVYLCVPVPASGKKMALDSLELDLQEVVEAPDTGDGD